MVQYFINAGFTTAYKNYAGFFIWAKSQYVADKCPVLTSILNRATTDYVLFDMDVEPDPELEIFE